MAGDDAYKAILTFNMDISANEITVILNGETYIVPKEYDTKTYYGTRDLINSGNATYDKYPFCITTGNGVNEIYVTTDIYNNHNPFTIKILSENVTTTPCFESSIANVLRDKLKERLVLFAIDQNVTINAKSRGTIHLGVASINPIPSSYISRALQNVRLDPNYPALVMRGCVIANDYATIDVYNTGDSNISLTTGNDSNSIDVVYLCVG